MYMTIKEILKNSLNRNFAYSSDIFDVFFNFTNKYAFAYTYTSQGATSVRRES